MYRRLRLFFVTVFLFFSNETVAFSSSSFAATQQRHVVGRPAKASALFQSSTPLYYHSGAETAPEEELTKTYSAPTSSDAATAKESPTDGVSMSLIKSIWFNQASILVFATVLASGVSFLFGHPVDFSSLHWNGSPDFHPFFNLDMTGLRLLEGFLATLPLVALGSAVEQSDRRDALRVNFSTTNMVISLFGRRRSEEEPTATSTPNVMMLSSLVALSTGLSEEIVFRGYIPTAIASLSHSIPLTLAGSAALFAFAHISPQSTPGENKVVGSLQFLNGIWYGLVYLVTGGDLLPCMIAHMLYDMHVLCETWHVVNCQMDYTQDAYQTQLDHAEEEAIKRVQQQAGPSLNTETLNFARRFFYAFDHEHKGSLSLSDVHRAVSYAFIKSKVIPEPERVDKEFDDVLKTREHPGLAPADRLSVSEFLQVLFALKSQGSVA